MPPTTESRTALGQHSYVSVGLVTALVMAALFYGKQLQRLDVIEAQQRETMSEVREIRSLLVRQTSVGR